MLLQYSSPDLLNSSITDAGSGVHMFAVHTGSVYTTERVYHPFAGTQDTSVRRRRTVMTDIHQRQVAEILWILSEPSSHRSSELKVPTRIGAVWVATRRSLEVPMCYTWFPFLSDSLPISSAVALLASSDLPFISTAFKLVIDFILLPCLAWGHTFSRFMNCTLRRWLR